jgi:hypothetical protein
MWVNPADGVGHRYRERIVMDGKVVDQWRSAPRLHDFAGFFEQTARGLSGQPDLAVPEAEQDLLGYDIDCLLFRDSHGRLWGPFDNHYFASIPYRLEEECRLGAAILRFALNTWAGDGRPATVYTLGAGAGTLARTIAKFGDGRIRTLNCSPTEGNRIAFFARRASADAYFHHGPFFELDDGRYAIDENLAPFRDGYDVLLEDTTFQMYGRDRIDQTGFIAPRLRDGGLLIQVHKIMHPDEATYLRRERQKDTEFKSRFFSHGQIADKRIGVLNRMDTLQVDLETSIAALAVYFTYSIITWNSGNFYTIVSSNSAGSIRRFVTSMIAPAIPPAFCYERLPLGFDRGERFAMTSNWDWRQHQGTKPTDQARTSVAAPASSAGSLL